MKKHIGWAYPCYQPILCKTGLHICRVVPTGNSVAFDWLDAGCAPYAVFFKEADAESFSPAGETAECHFEITGLTEGTDYAFFVACASAPEKKSETRLARPGKVEGTVVNYLHPSDRAYDFSGNYLCSPGLIRHPDGCLLACMDVYQDNAPQNVSMLYRSDDDGKTWHEVSELFPCFWPKMFLHKGLLYILGCSTEYGDLLIGASADCGKTFTEPVILLRGSNGKNRSVGIHKNPQPVLSYHGRIYNTLEWGSWGKGYHAAMVMSADENADLLDPASWSFTEPLLYNEAWEGVAKGHSTGTIEGCLTVGKDGNLYTVMRYDMYRTQPNYGLVLRYRVNTADPDAPLEYDRAIPFPANHSKFEIRYDETSGYYFSIASRITRPEDNGKRTLLSLMASKDMLEWIPLKDIFDEREADPSGKKIGFQYVDFFFEGDDLLFLCRTAVNGANSYHNSNYITFHRLDRFRDLLPKDR